MDEILEFEKSKSREEGREEGREEERKSMAMYIEAKRRRGISADDILKELEDSMN